MKNIIFVLGVFLFGVSAAATEFPTTPYDKSGIVNCALPGTTIEFALLGQGKVKVVNFSSNYDPFRVAARKPGWKAYTASIRDERMLILDNNENSRIFARLPDGKGLAFLYDGGVSDILCQILVQPD